MIHTEFAKWISHLKCRLHTGRHTERLVEMVGYEDRKLHKMSAVAEMGDRLVTIDMGRKWGGAAVGAWVPTGSVVLDDWLRIKI